MYLESILRYGKWTPGVVNGLPGGPDIWMSTDFYSQSIGNGNCFFRTLSYFLPGAQKEHQRLRALLCQFLHANNEQFNAIANQKDYVITSKASQLEEYATEVEIFASATFLGIQIWTFSPYGDFYRWQRQRPVSGLPSPFLLTEKAMHIKTCMNILSLCLLVKQV